MCILYICAPRIYKRCDKGGIIFDKYNEIYMVQMQFYDTIQV